MEVIGNENQIDRQLLFSLIGYQFGPEPEKKLNEIRVFKEQVANFLRLLLKLEKEDRVLDLGSGCGFVARALAPHVTQICCIDTNTQFLSICRTELEGFDKTQFHLVKNGNLSCIEKSSISHAYANSVFIHLDIFNIQMYLEEVHRVLKSGGKFAFNILNVDDLNPCEDERFRSTMDHFRQFPEHPIMQWNSLKILLSIAKSLGFSVCLANCVGQSLVYVLLKKNTLD